MAAQRRRSVPAARTMRPKLERIEYPAVRELQLSVPTTDGQIRNVITDVHTERCRCVNDVSQ